MERMTLMALQGFHHVALKSTDLQKSITFYMELMGATIRAQWDGAALMDTGNGNYVEIFAGGDTAQEHNEGYFHLAYRVTQASDVDQLTDRARDMGYPVTIEPRDVNLTPDYPARISFIKGPSGEVIEFFYDPN